MKMRWYEQTTCPRCRGSLAISTCSVFNTEQICMDCAEKEKQDPRYQEAVEAELRAVRRGDYNFPGIGR